MLFPAPAEAALCVLVLLSSCCLIKAVNWQGPFEKSSISGCDVCKEADSGYQTPDYGYQEVAAKTTGVRDDQGGAPGTGCAPVIACGGLEAVKTQCRDNYASCAAFVFDEDTGCGVLKTSGEVITPSGKEKQQVFKMV
jgi:hypothetical protein